MRPLKRTSLTAEVGLVAVVLAIGLAFTLTTKQASNRSIICAVLLVLGTVCIARALWSAPRPAWSKELEARLREVRTELAAISVSDAKIDALRYLAGCESGANGVFVTPSKGAPGLDLLPAGVRDVFSRYDRVEWPRGIARIGVEFVSRSCVREDCTVIGHMFPNNAAELAVCGEDEEIYRFDQSEPDSKVVNFPSIYHWILYRKAADETPFECGEIQN